MKERFEKAHEVLISGLCLSLYVFAKTFLINNLRDIVKNIGIIAVHFYVPFAAIQPPIGEIIREPMHRNKAC